MKLYSIDVRLYATAYIKAKSAAQARTIAESLKDRSPHIFGHAGDVLICALPYDHPDLPLVSLSPAMTIHGPDADAQIERAD